MSDVELTADELVGAIEQAAEDARLETMDHEEIENLRAACGVFLAKSERWYHSKREARLDWHRVGE